MYFRYILSFLFTVCFFLQLRAVPSEVKVRHLTVNEGLLRNAVFDLAQDKKGCIWIGGWDGLYSYDGYQLKLVCQNPIPQKKGEQVIRKLAIDDSSRIWMGTSEGLAYWDPVHEKAHVLHFTVPGRKTPDARITALQAGRNGLLWIGTQHGDIFLWNPRVRKLLHLADAVAEGLSMVTGFHEDAAGQVWAVTYEGTVHTFAPRSAGSDSWRRVYRQRLPFLNGACILSLLVDSRQRLWVGTNRGLYILEREKHRELTFSGNEAKLLVPDCEIRSMTETEGTVYLATDKGVCACSLERMSLSWIAPDYNRQNALNDHNLQKVYCDREGGLWIASFYGGVNYISPTAGNFQDHQQINQLLGGHVVSGIAEDARHNLWIGLEDGGLSYWDRATDRVHHLDAAPNALFRYSPKNVQTVYCHEDELYVGTFGQGMDIINLRTGTQTNYRKDAKNPGFSNSVYAFYKDAEGTLWIGTASGLYRSEGHRPPVAVDRIPSCKVNAIRADEEDNLWISTLSEGFFCMDRRTSRVRQWTCADSTGVKLPTNELTTLTPYGQSVYLGTQGYGLWCYGKKDGVLLPLAEEVLGRLFIFRIIPVQDYLWITTNRGLYAYSLTTRQIKQYTSHDGLRTDQFKNNSGILTSDGLVVLGSVQGINTFRPEKIRFNQVRPQVFLTGFFLQNQLVAAGDAGSVLPASIEYAGHLDVEQKHHSIGFQFASSSYSDVTSNRFEYMLEPFEKEWQRLSEGVHSVSYTNLQAGTYTFRVRTANKDGIWSEVKSVTVRVHPYWWLSWPMKMVYLFAVLSAVYLFFRAYRNKHKEEIRLLHIQKEQELYHSKMDFFTCMIHELRTPLTLILGPLEHVKKQTPPATPAYADLQVMERNGRRLLSLVNELMDFRKIEEKSYRIHLKSWDVRVLAGQVVQDFQPEVQHRKLALEWNCPPEECSALLDQEAFIKVLYNLLSNALKFAETKIQVVLGESSDRHFWLLSVSDDGPGIDPQQQKKVFEPFYQADNAGMATAGTGIGLFVARRLTELQNGSIQVRQNPEKGCCFELLLPKQGEQVRQSDPEAADEALLRPNDCADRPEAAVADGKLHLLIVEDHKEMQEYIRSLFVPEYQVDVCDNGQMALEQVRTHEYHLILTDLMMPVMGGVELCGILKNDVRTSHIPVLMLTAKCDEASQVEGFDSGADLYVTKPFSAAVLQAQVSALLRNRMNLKKEFFHNPEVHAETLCANHTDRDFLERLDQFIAGELQNSSLSVEDMAAHIGMGRSIFFQKIKELTGMTPNDYLRTYRLKCAASLLADGRLRISEICYEVGFSSPSYFAKRFCQQFGVSPSDYQKRMQANLQRSCQTLKQRL